MKLILDVGCADGSTIAYHWHKMGKCIGIDVDPILIEKAKQLPINAALFLIARGEALPFRDEMFDIINIEHVIEHVDNLDIFLDELVRVLKPGGKLHIAFPAAQIEQILGSLSSEYFSPLFHKRIIDKGELTKQLQRRNLDIKHFVRNQCFRGLMNVYKFWSGHRLNDHTGQPVMKSFILRIIQSFWVILEFPYLKIHWHLKKRKLLWIIPFIFILKLVFCPGIILCLLLNHWFGSNIDMTAIKCQASHNWMER